MNTEEHVTIPEQKVPILTTVDVAVIGGGNAGFVAAIAAARSGAKTALIEQHAFIGGCNTATYNTGPGWLGDSDCNRIIGGPGYEFLLRMEEEEAAIINRERWRAQIFPETTKKIALEMVLEAGVDLYLHTWFSEVLMDGDKITAIVLHNKSGTQVIRAKTFVDCTGDGDVAARAGADFEHLDPNDPRNWQTSVDLTVCNIDAPRVLQWARNNRELLQGGGNNLPESDDCVGIQPGVAINIKNSESSYGEKAFGKSGKVLKLIQHRGTMPTLKLMIRRSTTRVQGNVEIDPKDVRDITRAEVEGRKQAYEHLAYLKETIDGMQDAFIISQNHLGVRVTRRIIGDYYITIDDLVENVRLDDVVCLNARSIDKHMPGDKFEISFLEGNHDVPYRALIAQGISNLTMAGRCISCDQEAHASLRGAATCWGTGHAAGTAAALASRREGNVRSVEINELQSLLKEQGAILSTEPA